MSRPLAAGQPSPTVAAQPNVIAAAPVRYAQPSADATAPRLYPIPIPFASPFPILGTPPPAPYPAAAFYPMAPLSAFPPFMRPGTFPGPPVDLHPPPPPPPPPPGVLGPYPGTFPRPRVDLHPPPPPPPPPGVLGPYPGTPSLPTAGPRYTTQFPVCPGPPGFSPRPIYPLPGVFSHQRPALIRAIADPVTMTRPPVAPVAPVAPVDTPQFKIYVGKIAATVENDFVLSLLQVCGVVKSWEPVINPIDGSRTGFGFCEFESAEGSLRAMRLLNKLSVDGQELVLNVNQATRDYFQKYGESTPEEKAKEAETETRDGVVSLADNGNDLSRATPEVKAKEAETEKKDGVVSSADNQNDLSRATPEVKAKEAETERRDGVVSSPDNGNDLSRAILDVTRRGAVVMQRIRSLIEGETKRCQADKDVMERIHSLIEERMKSKLPGSPSLAVQVPACIVDENGDDDTGSGALEERKIRRQCEQEEHLGEMKAVGSEGQKDREMTAAGMSSPQIGEAPSMHVPMSHESTAEHERECQHRERDGLHNRNGEEQGRQRKAVGSEGRKDREVTAAGKSLQIDEAPSMHVHMECISTVEHDRKSQLRGRDGFRKSNGEKIGRERKAVGSEAQKDREVTASGKSSLQLELLPSMHNSAGEKVGFELQATSNSGEKPTLDAKQLLATVPKTKKELFSHDVNWAIYDEYGLHKRMRPWISKKATAVFDEELAEFVDYVVACIKEHVNAPRMLELLESLLDDDAEKFVALTWRKLIFEIKKVEEGLA
ncbi:hypothetical protein QYE76_004904 [Lolium multiflorum]|uniref:Uncharacterized protein n=1 Tax=Lolium multiflorum TaxID=4521 RepID=A0AAD8W1U1_LOLMU|nr:hypothetical protein QYE76_004904 [Lolium multiflorum]